MNRYAMWLVIALFGPILPLAADAREGHEEPPAQVEIRRAELRDEKRDRVVPVKYYIPKAPTASPDGGATVAPRPLVLLSHGLGGTREVAGYLGQYLAQRGYVVAAVQHPGSDDSVWRG